jgi:hypothetical protein
MRPPSHAKLPLPSPKAAATQSQSCRYPVPKLPLPSPKAAATQSQSCRYPVPNRRPLTAEHTAAHVFVVNRIRQALHRQPMPGAGINAAVT